MRHRNVPVRGLFVSTLAALALVGGGCALFAPQQPDYTPPDVTVQPNGPVSTGELPVISLSSVDGDFTGVQGSYCYGTTCVDKIPPVQLIADAGIGFAEISSRQFVVRTSSPATSVSVSVFDEENTALDCESTVSRTSDTEFVVELCNDVYGLLVLGVFMTDDQGDMTYLFPLDVPQSPIITKQNGTTMIEAERFTWSVPATNSVETLDSRLRVQNFVATGDGYVLRDGEFFIEVYFGGDLTEEVFREQYGTQSEQVFQDLVVVRGDDRVAGGETETGGYGYFAEFVDGTVAIHIYSPSQAGVDAASALLETWNWESDAESVR